MTTALAPVAALLLSVAILLTGNGLQGTLLPIRAQLELFSTASIGLLGSAYFLGFAAGCLLGPRLLRRVGHIRTFTAMAAVASSVPLAHALVLVPAPWWLMRAATGFCFAVLYMVIESWLNERATRETRGLVLSVYLVINMSVLTLGQMMVTLYDPSEFALFALASILVSLAAVPVAMTAAAAPAPVASVKVRIARLYRISPVGFMGCLGVGLANGAFWSLGPLYAEQSGLSLTGIAVFMSATVLGGAIGQWPIGRLSDRTDRRRVLLAVCVLAALPAVAIATLGSRLGGGLHVVAALWGVFAFPVYALSAAHANDFAAPDEFVEVSSSLLLVYAGGAVAGPLLASALMTALHVGALYGFTAIVHVALAAFTLYRMRQRAAAPMEEHVPFMRALEAVQTVSPVFETQPSGPEAQAAPVEAGDSPSPRSEDTQ